MKNTTMTFDEILNNEDLYRIVEAIEHDSSDPENIEIAIKELYDRTGFVYDKTGYEDFTSSLV
jgi:hypothetical protein